MHCAQGDTDAPELQLKIVEQYKKCSGFLKIVKS